MRLLCRFGFHKRKWYGLLYAYCEYCKSPLIYGIDDITGTSLKHEEIISKLNDAGIHVEPEANRE